ncbi:MAG: hypothetical protein PUD52_07695 [Prevotella sp.]|nr:hypothetical protein [Prevotella sp.]
MEMEPLTTVDYEDIASVFSYEMFDRQMNTFIAMWNMLIGAWNDYGTQELTFDILSLSSKAARLCLMADEDMVRQNHDLQRSRKLRNMEYAATLEKMVTERITPLVQDAIRRVRSEGRLEGHKWKRTTATILSMLPQLDDIASNEKYKFTAYSKEVALMEGLLNKKYKPTKYPGMPSEERMWNLLLLFMRTVYLMMHFSRAENLCGVSLSDEEAGLILEASIQKYIDSPKGKEDIDIYFATLRYDNDGHGLSVSQLRDARRKIREAVPRSLQLVFLNHAGNLEAMAQAFISQGGCKDDDYEPFVSAVAKWFIIEQKIHSIEHPKDCITTIHNQVFHTAVNGRLVDMLRLRDSIGKMAKAITRKNHWFCLWCVLRHHNLIADMSHEHFAQQMMHPEWFGHLPADKHFNGDTLREYSGYFTLYDYAAWDNAAFLDYRNLNGKNKWSEKLCDKLLGKCLEMESLYVRV